MKILLTNRCNLNCTYCYEGTKGNGDLDFSTGRLAIDYYLDKFKDVLRIVGSVPIVYHGGEPLLKFDLLKNLSEYAIRQSELLQLKCDFSFTTNGVLLTEEMVAFLKKNNFTVNISLDGQKKFHNQNRVDYQNHGTFDKIFENAHMIQAALNHKFAIRMTVTRDSIEYMTENVRYFVNNGFDNINIALDYFSDWGDNLKYIKTEFEKLEKYYLEYRKVHKLVIDIFDGKIPLLFTDEEPLFCNAGFEDYVLDVDGMYFPCFYGMKKGFDIGNVTSGIDGRLRNRKIRDALYNKTVQFEECKQCTIQKFCHSHKCGFLNYDTTGYLNVANKVLCQQEKSLYPILNRIVKVLEERKDTVIEIYKQRAHTTV
ncbi:radical SAM/SPASM domain-containing protein [Lachnotalea glycerini]|uniref:Radical SAM protein n=1 Tax=Lachnotalea glycerini TaxID=1763509 RepID=A0A371J9E8_9FIRM|nr:radical SAM protein [Lachnotalea glycerini]RDY29307.1 radical SAM protein [Lachnotalea glycerini]